ncbi:MAG: hypothetical protein LAN62_10010 [Acidobacteriia bacterium]|nr:hypothetical protein [Terriglobia bacterium]
MPRTQLHQLPAQGASGLRIQLPELGRPRSLKGPTVKNALTAATDNVGEGLALPREPADRRARLLVAQVPQSEPAAFPGPTVFGVGPSGKIGMGTRLQIASH